MLYFFHTKKGTSSKVDSGVAFKKAGALAAELQKKKPDAAFFTVTDENWNDQVIDEYIQSQGLFSNKYIVLIKGIFVKKELKEMFLEKIKEIAESPNIFIVAEGVLDAASLKKIEKHAAKIQEFEGGVSASGEALASGQDFKIFDMADALGARDKKRLWTLYRKAIDSGKVPEEIHGILFWQAKSMAIARETKNASESGLNPFVYGKAKRFAENYSKEELEGLLKGLVSIYHDAHRGLHDFETSLEVLILEKV
jgi:DNA polymerase III delta subunit